MRYEKVLRNLKFEHEDIQKKKNHKKCKEDPCQIKWLIHFLEAHPPVSESVFNGKAEKVSGRKTNF